MPFRFKCSRLLVSIYRPTIRGFLWLAAVYGLEFEEIYYILAGVSVGDIVLRLEYLSGHIWVLFE